MASLTTRAQDAVWNGSVAAGQVMHENLVFGVSGCYLLGCVTLSVRGTGIYLSQMNGLGIGGGPSMGFASRSASQSCEDTLDFGIGFVSANFGRTSAGIDWSDFSFSVGPSWASGSAGAGKTWTLVSE